MIFKLKGTASLKIENKIIIDVNNIFYEINTTDSFLSEIKMDEALEIYITKIIKEDEHTMFGFKTLFEKIWFDNLIKIDGLGAKITIKLMSKLNIDEISNAILSKDNKAFEQISGIGSKIANRIVNEMSNKVSKIESQLLTLGYQRKESQTKDSNENNIENEILEHSIAALTSLGFTQDVKRKAIKIIDQLEKEGKKFSAEDVVSSFLKIN